MKIVLKRSEVTGKIPSVDDLSLGELAINTTDGTLYTKKSVNGVETVIQVGVPAGSGASDPGTGSGNLDSNSPAMNSITPTGYGQFVGLPDATTMSTAATNVFTIVNESPNYSLGVRDFGGVLRRVIPPQSQCNIGLKNKSTVNDSWTYFMSSLEGSALVLGEVILPSTIYPISPDLVSQVRFGDVLVSVGVTGLPTNNFYTGQTYLLVGDLTNGNVSAPIPVFGANETGGLSSIFKLTETTGVIIKRNSGRVNAVVFSLSGSTLTLGTVYNPVWPETNDGLTDLGQFVANGPNNFLLTYTSNGQSNYSTYARYFTVSGSALLAGPSALIVSGASQVVSAPYRNTELVSGNTFFNYGYNDGTSYSGYSLTVSSSGGTAVGQQVFTTPGTFSFVVPNGVTTLSGVAVGAGGGGGWGSSADGGGMGGSGGSLRWMANVPVTPGETLTVVVGAAGVGKSSGNYLGAAGGDTYIQRGNTVLIRGGGGQSTGPSLASTPLGNITGGGTTGGGTGGKGGQNGTGTNGYGGGGGGAGGYSGDGGDGGFANIGRVPGSGTGGGGAGGMYGYILSNTAGGGGGGVGLFGEGTSGAAVTDFVGNGGKGGAGGSNGTIGGNANFADSNGNLCRGGAGGLYGAGGGGGSTSSPNRGGNGSVGAVRLIWGVGRNYPSTIVQDQPVTSTGGQIVVGTAVMIPISSTQLSSQSFPNVHGNKAVRLPGTNKWAQFFVDSSTSEMAVQCWMFNGTTLGLGPKLVSSAMGRSAPTNTYVAPVAFSSNVALNCLTLSPASAPAYSQLSAVMIAPDGTPTVITTQTVDFVSTFKSTEIVTYSTTLLNTVLRWKFTGSIFELGSTTYFGLNDCQFNVNTFTGASTVNFVLPQTQSGTSYIVPNTSTGIVTALQDAKIKASPMFKTMALSLKSSPQDSKVGGFGIARNFVGSEVVKRVSFAAMDVVQSDPAPAPVAAFVNVPTITSPLYPIQPDTFIISTSGFGTTGLSDVHLSTDYQVWAWVGENQLGTKVWEVLGDTTNKLSIRLPTGVVSPNTPYTIRVRHNGASRGTSEWASTSIITSSAFAPTVPGTAYAGGFYAGRYQIGNDLYAIVVAPKSTEMFSYWSPTLGGVGLNNSQFDGKVNTDASTGAVATSTKALTTGGFNDWYIGSHYENDLIHRYLRPTADGNVTGNNLLSVPYGYNQYSIPNGVAYTTNSPGQTTDAAWKTGGAQALPTELASSSTHSGGGLYISTQMTNGVVLTRGFNISMNYRPIRRVKLNFD